MADVSGLNLLQLRCRGRGRNGGPYGPSLLDPRHALIAFAPRVTDTPENDNRKRREWPLPALTAVGNLADAFTYEGTTMNWDIIEGDWKQFKGHVKEKWGKLTDDNLDVIAGKRDQLAGRIQETYGITKDQAELQVQAFEQTHKDYEPKTLA